MSRKTKVNNCFDFALNIESVDQISDDHLRRVYRLDSEICKSKANKNCAQNIRCLNGLGEKTWLSDADSASAELNDQLLGRRSATSFVGLKNLGATCYVNCLLQVWYHNPILRLAIYRWKQEEDAEELQKMVTDDPSDAPSDDSVPNNCIGKLQLIFALMQFGNRSSVDPKPFITSLGLDENRQQDAHEFSSLFFSHVEKKLLFQSNPEVKNVIQSQYRGEIAYVTRCLTCESVSEQKSLFYELDLNIKGRKHLNDSLTDYLQFESLEGNNQYFCSKCSQKRDAVRRIELKKLPPILNIQLLRFVFEPQIKKLNSFIQFPDTLDLKQFIDSSVAKELTPEETTYHLSAVLIHRGPSAHSGHYIAHIKDEKSGFWFKFNDEKVEEIEGKKLKLDSDDGNDEVIEINGNEKKETKERTKGTHNSNNAYMLVYKNETQQRIDLDNTFEAWDLPQYLIKAIELDNQLFETSVSELLNQRESERLVENARKEEIRKIYPHLSTNTCDESSFEFIAKKWLTEWLNTKASDPIKAVDNKELLCLHSKLNFKAISSVKLISKNGADLLYDSYGGGPRLTPSAHMLCKACVAKHVEVIKTKARIDEDIKRITSQLKFSLIPDEESFWVGKESLKSWKQIKLQTIESKTWDTTDTSDDSVEVIEPESNSGISRFNEDIICKHGELTPDENKGRLVCKIVWQTLKSYFPDCREFASDSKVCQNCLTYNIELQTMKAQHKELAMRQKSVLPHLLAERHRLVWDDLQITETYYALSRQFLTSWKKFINDPLKYNPPEKIDNSNLLCAHENFLYPANYETEIIGIDSKFVLVSKDEWSVLTNFYPHQSEIAFHVVLDENNIKSFDSKPAYCHSCYQSLILQEERDRLTYKNESIFVVKTENNEINSDDSLDNKVGGSDAYHSKTNDKKPKKDINKNSLSDGLSQGVQGLRRSSRRRKNRNEKEIKVSSTTTLLELKVEIFKVAPFDQHLSIDSRPLDQNGKTLAELHVEPYSIINLKVDQEPSNDCIVDDEYLKGGMPDIGFKGKVRVSDERKTRRSVPSGEPFSEFADWSPTEASNQLE